MLILTRKFDETIEIPSLGVSVLVVSIHPNKVRLGVTAPESASILRGEILEEIECDKEATS